MPTKDENKLLRKSQFEKVIEELCKKIKAKFVSDVQLVTEQDTNDGNKEKYKIQVTKDGVGENREPFLVTEWKDLKDVQEYPYANLLDSSKHESRKHLSQDGAIQAGVSDYGILSVDVESSTAYTFLKRTNGNPDIKIREEQEDGNLAHFTNQNHGASSNGWYKCNFTTTGQTKKLIIEVKLDEDGRSGQEMLIKSDSIETGTLAFIPFSDNYTRQIKNTSIGFTPSGSNLKSTTVESAIKELDEKTHGGIKTWGDLDHVNESDYVNLLDYSKRRLNSALNSDGSINPSTGNSWNTISVDIKPDTTYTFINNFSNGVRCAIHDENGIVLQHHNTNATSKDGWHRKVLNPHANASKFILEFDSNTDRSRQLMLIENDHSQSKISNFITYNSDGNKIVIGTEVSHSFNPEGTQLKSNTTSGAIKELDKMTESFVKKWNDLEYVKTKTFTNVLSTVSPQVNRAYNGNGQLTTQTGKNSYRFRIEATEEYYLVSNIEDIETLSVQYVRMASGSIGVAPYGSWVKHGTNKFGQHIFKMRKYVDQGQPFEATFQYDTTKTPEQQQFIIYKGSDGEPRSKYVETTENYYTYDGDKVETTYHGLTGIVAKDLKGALEELASKLSGTGSGTVQKVNGIEPTKDDEANVVLTANPTFDQNNLKLNIVGGTPETFATIVCMADGEADAIIAGLNMN